MNLNQLNNKKKWLKIVNVITISWWKPININLITQKINLNQFNNFKSLSQYYDCKMMKINLNRFNYPKKKEL